MKREMIQKVRGGINGDAQSRHRLRRLQSFDQGALAIVIHWHCFDIL